LLLSYFLLDCINYYNNQIEIPKFILRLRLLGNDFITSVLISKNIAQKIKI